MKVAVIGAGGTRVPLLVQGLLRRAREISLDEVRLVDADTRRLDAMEPLIRHQIALSGEAVTLSRGSLEEALPGVSFVFSAIRVGGLAARILDEKIPLAHGVIGQETTGPGGMAMALRTIPVVLEIAGAIRRLQPDAWLLNFTNPSGLITEALLRHGHRRVVGLCDAPWGLARALAVHLGLPEDALALSYGGLNHLGWATDVRDAEGASRMAELLAKARILVEEVRPLNAFSPELIRHLGALPNEYLTYYYDRDRALRRLLAAASTRGEELLQREEELYRTLADRADARDPGGALEAYRTFVVGRRGGYMAREIGRRRPVPEEGVFTEEGYEGLALRVMTGLMGTGSQRLIVNAPAPSAAGPDCVVETAFTVDGGLVPGPWPDLPPHALRLVQDVKAYELLTIEAALEGRARSAVEALMVHPLVGDHRLAAAIVEEVLKAEAPFLPRFHDPIQEVQP